MPDFADGQAQGMLIGGEVIQVQKDIDFERVAASKSKKAKMIYQKMLNTMTITRSADNYRQGMNALGMTLQQAAWSKGQITLTQERNADMFRGEDEDLLGDGENGGQGVGVGNQMINKENIMGEIFSRVATVQSDGVNMPGAAGEASGGVNMEVEKSIKDIIDERQ